MTWVIDGGDRGRSRVRHGPPCYDRPVGDEDRAVRAARRRSWPVRKLRLGEEDGTENLSATTSVAERLAMMWPLALDAWAVLGHPMPDYRRSEAPGRVLRPKERTE